MESPTLLEQPAGSRAGPPQPMARKPIHQKSPRTSNQDISPDTVNKAKETNQSVALDSSQHIGPRTAASPLKETQISTTECENIVESSDDRRNDCESSEDSKMQPSSPPFERETTPQETLPQPPMETSAPTAHQPDAFDSSHPKNITSEIRAYSCKNVLIQLKNWLIQHKLFVVLVVLSVLALILALWVHSKEPAFSMDGFVPMRCNHFHNLRSKYPNTDDMLWATLVIGVERAVNDPGEPATFIFLHNSSSVDQSLLNDVVRITLECFDYRQDAIWRTSNDFQSAEVGQDFGTALDRHRKELQSQGVLVVRDLDQISPHAAQVFFTICDSQEPLVKKAAIFFTIDISERITTTTSQSQLSSPTSIAERILKDLWRNELHSNVLDPLLGRLTENVFIID